VDLRRLKAFITMVDLGSMTRAADRLHIAQPALSQQVARLEESFGVPLLVRSRQGIVPTPAGRTLYRHAQVILRQLAQAQSEVSSAGKNLSGFVSIGMPLTTSSIIATPLLLAAHQHYPDIRLHIADGMAGGLLSELTMNSRLDMALLSDVGPVRGLDFRPLIAERLILIAPDDYPLEVQNGAVSVASLAAHRLILPGSTNRLRELFEAAFAAKGLRPQVVAELDTVPSLCSACMSGLGLTVLPASTAQGLQTGLSWYRLEEPEIERTISLVIPEASTMSAAAGVIYELAFEVTTKLVLDGKWPGARLLDRGKEDAHAGNALL
jgi:LysR family nitrogen assimilation transcriptional regulator